MEDAYKLDDPYNDVPAGGGGVGSVGARNKKPIIIAIFAIVAAVVLVLAGLGIWNAVRPADIGAYEDMPMTVIGLADEPFEITDADLVALDCTSMKVTGHGQGEGGQSKAGTIEAYGPTLETFLAQYGVAPTDFGRIIFTCRDGYDVVLFGDMLTEEVVMSVAQGKDALWEQQQPMRLVIPSQGSGNWAYGVETITFQE